jgi:hypothetical protein
MGQTRPGAGRSATAIVIIGVGVFFLLVQVGIFSFSLMGVLWPFFVIGPGLIFLYFAATGGRDLASLAIPGSIVTGTGAILLFQSLTKRWESWAYIWTLYPVFLGLGLIYLGRRTQNRGTHTTGLGFVRWGMIAFLIFGAFFEIFIFSGFDIGGYILPAILILLGARMLLRSSRRSEAQRKAKTGDLALDDDDLMFSGGPVVRPRSGFAPSASEELRRKIDLALMEEDDLPEGEPEE